MRFPWTRESLNFYFTMFLFFLFLKNKNKNRLNMVYIDKKFKEVFNVKEDLKIWKNFVIEN